MTMMRWKPEQLAAHQARLRAATAGPVAVRADGRVEPMPARASGTLMAHGTDARILLLPYPVSANRYWRSLSHGRVVVSEEGRAFKAEVRARAVQAGLVDPIVGPVRVGFQLHPKQVKDAAARERKFGPLWHLDLRCIDLGNSEKILSDALNGLAWVDDKQIVEFVKRRGYPVEDGAVSISIAPGMWT